jgi:hypothetical protein
MGFGDFIPGGRSIQFQRRIVVELILNKASRLEYSPRPLNVITVDFIGAGSAPNATNALLIVSGDRAAQRKSGDRRPKAQRQRTATATDGERSMNISVCCRSAPRSNCTMLACTNTRITRGSNAANHGDLT